MFEINSADILYLLIGIDIPWIIGLLFSSEAESRKSKWFQAGAIFLVHPLMLLIVKQVSNKSYEEIFSPQIDGISFPLLGIAVLIGVIAAVIAFAIISLKSKDLVSSNAVDKLYHDFTENVASGQSITLFGGDLSFLGISQKCPFVDNFVCSKMDKNISNMMHRLQNKQCSTCCYGKRQYQQFIRLKKTQKISLHILCREPRDDEDDLNYRILLGNLISVFKKKIVIKYYDHETMDKIYILARIRKDSARTESMFWHWKIKTKKYKKPLEWKTSDVGDPAGYTIHYLLNMFWDKFNEIDQDKRNILVNEFKKS